MKKYLFFTLAIIWITFLMFNKTIDTTVGIAMRKRNIIIRLSIFALRMFKSVMLMSLVVVNIFMAISLIDGKKEVK